MPRFLQLEASTTGGGGVVCELATPATPLIAIVPGMAIEIIEQIDSETPQAVGNHRDFAITVRMIGDTTFLTVTPADQNRWYQIGQTPAPFTNDIYPAIRARWYQRVISLDAYVGYNLRSVQLMAIGGLAGTYKLRFASAAITKYRTPVYWFYRDGMPLPNTATLGSVAPLSSGRMCMVDMHEHFPLLCTTDVTPDTILDSIKVDRSSGGTVRRWVEWAKRKDEFALEFPAMTELERQALLAFYDVYRGGDDWFFWQHRSNYPDQRVVFGGPPVIVPVRLNGADMRYRAQVSLQEV